MADKQTRPTFAERQAKRLNARIAIGKADKNWRVQQNLSQQNGHDWAKGWRIPYHNSQIAYWEKGILNPKDEFWYAREEYNWSIANNIFPPSLSRTLLDKLKVAKPFLTVDGKVALAADFHAMFGGTQEIREEYLAKGELTDDFCKEYSHVLERAFAKIGRERMLSPEKAWAELKKTQDFPTDEVYLATCADILRGAHELTADEVYWCLDLVGGKYCACYRGLGLLAKTEDGCVDIPELDRENKTLLALASS